MAVERVVYRTSHFAPKRVKYSIPNTTPTVTKSHNMDPYPSYPPALKYMGMNEESRREKRARDIIAWVDRRGRDDFEITCPPTTGAKEIDERAIVESLEALKRRFDDFNMKLDQIAEMKATKEMPEVVEETETLSETCRQLQSELNATLKRNELLESKMESIQEQVSTLKMIASNTIQHNDLLEIKMDSLEERVAALDMMAKNTIWDEADSKMTSDNFWEGSDDHSHLRWVSDSEEDEWEEDSESSS